MHGYDNILPSMQVCMHGNNIEFMFEVYHLFQAIFIAHGPAFKKGYVADGFANIELYNLMCGELT